jgi:hypothetical protein
MSEPAIRGHILAYTASFVHGECGSAIASRATSLMSLDLRTTLRELDPAAWYPRRYQEELLGALVKAHDDEGASRRELLRCGSGMVYANNEFMKLLVQLLTPELFLKKADRLWLRDHRNSGTCELESLDGDARVGRLRLRGVLGYAHAGIVWLGWIRGALSGTAGRGAQVTQQGWTSASPAPDEIGYEVRWS